MDSTFKRPRTKQANGKCGHCGKQIPSNFRSSKKFCDRKCEYRSTSESKGHVRRLGTMERFWAKADKRGPDECWEWVGRALKHGYGTFSVGGRAGSMESASRFSYRVHNGEIPEGAMVRHRCDNPPCVNPSHLILGSHDDNMRDMAERERSGTTRLTAGDVIAIRKCLDAGESKKSLADRFGVVPGTIWFIATGKTWKHV